jgi:glycosyltransferase involved in cell wall biosynthesis
VSVVIPVYQVERTLSQALRSAVEQTFSDLEVLLVDDGSPDGSMASVREFTDPRIRRLSQPHRGLSAARNTGIRAARGTLIAFLDSDDVWQPDKLARQVRHLNDNPAVGLSFCGAEFIDATGRPLGLAQLPRLSGIRPEDVLCNNPIKNGSVPLVRLKALRDSCLREDGVERYFDENLSTLEDLECWLRLALFTTFKLEGLPDILVGYRTSGGGLSADPRAGLQAFDQMLLRVRLYAPDFVSRWAGPARGYQLRYRAQRAILLGQDRAAAVPLLRAALRHHPALLWEDPSKTWLTLAASYLRWWLPDRHFGVAKSLAYQGVSALQRLGFLRD